MARPTHVYTIEYVAMLIGENLELVQEIIASNSDNIDYGEMIHAYDGSSCPTNAQTTSVPAGMSQNDRKTL